MASSTTAAAAATTTTAQQPTATTPNQESLMMSFKRDFAQKFSINSNNSQVAGLNYLPSSSLMRCKIS